jgi:hypothetical protein
VRCHHQTDTVAFTYSSRRFGIESGNHVNCFLSGNGAHRIDETASSCNQADGRFQHLSLLVSKRRDVFLLDPMEDFGSAPQGAEPRARSIQ